MLSAGARAIPALLSLAALSLPPRLARAESTTPVLAGQAQPLAPAPTPAPPPQGATPPAPTPPQGGAGGDGAKQKQASIVIEESTSAAEPPPPPPMGEERAAIGEYIRTHTDDVRDCYDKRIKERPTLHGKLIARFDIGPSGKVIGATADGIADTLLVSCVVQVVRKWEFDKPAAGGKLRVAYPFVFKALAADNR